MTDSAGGKVSAPARVLVVSHEASRTGAPRVAVSLTEALVMAGFDVTVRLRWRGPLQKEFEALAPTRLETASLLRVALRRSPRTTPSAHRVGAWAVRRDLRRIRPQVIWCNTTLNAPYVDAGLAMGIPVILYSHESGERAAEVLDRYRSSAAELAEQARKGPGALTLVGCSSDTADGLAAALGVPGDLARRLHSPVDVAHQRDVARQADNAGSGGQVDDRKQVVACGTADARKGFDVFCAAAEIAEARGARQRWRWLGAEIGHVDLADIDAAPNMAAVEMSGPKPSVAADLAAASVFVLASRADPFPLVVLEAMALGVPVIASDLPGPREQLGEFGIFVPVGDPSALAAAVDDLLANPEEAAARGEALAARCEKRWDVAAFRVRAIALTQAALGARR